MTRRSVISGLRRREPRKRVAMTASSRTPILVAAVGIVAAMIGSVPTTAGTVRSLVHRLPQVCDPGAETIELYAERLGKNRIGYGLTPDRAKIPGPTLKMTEGECLAVRLVNHTDKRLSMHAHGVGYTVASDGTPLNRGCVRPGRSRTYVFEAHAPFTRADGTVAAGSAGYWHYHDHCMGSEHGTEGINAGLFGALIVRRPEDPLPDRRPFVVVMKDFTINLETAPDTPTFKANEGERIEFVVIGHGNLFHTFHLHGHRWADTRTGMPSGLEASTQVIDNRTLGPADSFGFQVIAGEGVGPGLWMYHCHVQDHSDAGMTGNLLVRTPDGEIPQAAKKALRAFKREAGTHAGHNAAH